MQGTWQTDDPRAMVTSARVPIAVVGAAGLILALAPQMRDLLAALGDDVRGGWMFVAAAAAWGFSSWYWARTALVALHGDAVRDAPGAAGRMFRWLPRLLLIAAFAVVAALVAASRSDQRPFILYVGASLAVGGLLFALVILRTALFGARAEEVRPVPPEPFRRWVGSIPERLAVLLRAAPGGPLAALLFLAAALGLAVWAARDLPGFAATFPGPAAALVGLAAIVPWATVAVALLDQWDIPLLHRFPVVLAVLAWSLAGPTAPAERHAVRVATDGPRGPEDRVTLAEAVEAWLDRCAAGAGDAKVVIVAAAGGASRAALWTTTVLADLEREAALHRHLFAISGVSGGALGGAVHLAAREEAGLRCDSGRAPPGLAERAEKAIGQDFLGPTLAAYLFQDTWQLLTAWAQVAASRLAGRGDRAFLLPDRAAALEDAFSRAWDSAARRPGLFDRAFLAAWYGGGRFDPSLPLLFQNGADAATGNRIITAPVAFLPRLADPRAAPPLSPFAAATDHLALIGGDVRLSTSVTNSARFPYVTPTGWIAVPPGPDGRHAKRQIVDGGYLDNLGARTAVEIADAVAEAARARGRTVTPVIVAISPHGEQGLAPNDVARCDTIGTPAWPVPSEQASELLAPFVGLAASRAGHTALALESLRARFCPNAADPRQRFFHFYLPARCEARAGGVRCEDVPLNWVLSARMRDHILAQMRQDRFNRAEAERLAALLAR